MTVARILVTGGAGFIGAPTVSLLLAAGHPVTVVDNLSTGQLQRLPAKHPKLQFVQGDILEDALIARLVNDSDIVLHLAAIVSVPLSIQQAMAAFKVNVDGFLRVLEAIRHATHAVRLVYASSAAVYGNSQTLPCHERAILALPLSPYALHKINNEQYAGLYQRLYGIQTLGLRYFNVYGVSQEATSPYAGVISRFVRDYQTNQVLKIFGDGKQSRDFIHVDDVAHANCVALASEVTGVLNIATGQPTTLLDLIHCIERVGGKPALSQHYPEREGDIDVSYADVTRAREVLHWRDSVILSAGIAALMH